MVDRLKRRDFLKVAALAATACGISTPLFNVQINVNKPHERESEMVLEDRVKLIDKTGYSLTLLDNTLDHIRYRAKLTDTRHLIPENFRCNAMVDLEYGAGTEYERNMQPYADIVNDRNSPPTVKIHMGYWLTNNALPDTFLDEDIWIYLTYLKLDMSSHLVRSVCLAYGIDDENSTIAGNMYYNAMLYKINSKEFKLEDETQDKLVQEDNNYPRPEMLFDIGNASFLNPRV